MAKHVSKYKFSIYKCKAMIMGTPSVTHQEKNECNTVPVPMLPTGSPVEF